MFDFRRVREAPEERGLLLPRLAPHLVRPVAFIYPLTHRGWERVYVAAALTLYDGLAAVSRTTSGAPPRRHFTKTAALELVPSLRKDALVGAVQYYDAQVDDARHTMFLVRTAVAYGALAANRSRVTGFIRQGERVTGVRVRDLETGQDLPIRARQVLNATGVWTAETQQWWASVGGFGSRPARASTWWCPATGLRPSAA